MDRPCIARRIVAIVTFRSSPIRAAPVPGHHAEERTRRTANEENRRTAALNDRHPSASPGPASDAGVHRTERGPRSSAANRSAHEQMRPIVSI
jgi:hypothetical protein